MKPFVTVYIPTYNGEKYIKDCLDSVLNQTFQDFEIVICDDRSSDGTVGIIKEYVRKDSRVIFFKNKNNLGCICNHNHCISYARGEWVKPLNHDDLLRSTCLEEMIKHATLGIPIISCRRNFIFAENDNNFKDACEFSFTHVDDYFPNKTIFSSKDMSCAAIDYLGENFIGEPTAVMVRRDMFFRFGSLNPYMLMLGDLEYWLRVSSNMGFVFIPKVLADFRIHSNSITGKSKSKRLKPVFDQIILLHEFTFNPVYENLRKMVSQFRSGVSLEDLLSWSLKTRYKLIMNGCKGDVQEAQNSWNELLCNYPALVGVFKKNLIRMHLKKIVKLCFK